MNHLKWIAAFFPLAVDPAIVAGSSLGRAKSLSDETLLRAIISVIDYAVQQTILEPNTPYNT